jgi:hypothetical protein
MLSYLDGTLKVLKNFLLPLKTLICVAENETVQISATIVNAPHAAFVSE